MILMEPLISLCLVGPKRVFSAGDELVAEYQLDAVRPEEIHSVEASVLWFTEGKGDEDMGVHFFERRVPTDADAADLRALHRITTRLPNSPLSYRGALFTIRWCVRVRVFLRGGRDAMHEVPFVLGAVPAVAVASSRPGNEG
jgi:hypothetical protein